MLRRIILIGSSSKLVFAPNKQYRQTDLTLNIVCPQVDAQSLLPSVFYGIEQRKTSVNCLLSILTVLPHLLLSLKLVRGDSEISGTVFVQIIGCKTSEIDILVCFHVSYCMSSGG